MISGRYLSCWQLYNIFSCSYMFTKTLFISEHLNHNDLYLKIVLSDNFISDCLCWETKTVNFGNSWIDTNQSQCYLVRSRLHQCLISKHVRFRSYYGGRFASQSVRNFHHQINLLHNLWLRLFNVNVMFYCPIWLIIILYKMLIDFVPLLCCIIW